MLLQGIFRPTFDSQENHCQRAHLSDLYVVVIDRMWLIISCERTFATCHSVKRLRQVKKTASSENKQVERLVFPNCASKVDKDEWNKMVFHESCSVSMQFFFEFSRC